MEKFTENTKQNSLDISLLAKAEIHQLPISCNNTQIGFPTNFCIHHRFEFQAEQSPDNVAVTFEKKQITYRELNCRANQLAYYLKTLGVGPETLVGICVERSLEMFIAIVGILKAGGAYVPFDPAYPSERLALMLEDSQLPVLVTQQNQLGNLPQHIAQVVCLDSDWKAIAQQSDKNPNNSVNPNNLAYTIYTSGSTGKPKGVQITHGAVINLLHSMQQEPGFTAQDVFLAVTTICFDMSVPELFLPLIVGARIVVVARQVASDAAQLSRAIVESGATVMQATPATWRMLIAIGWQGNRNLKILCGGEALTRNMANQLLERSSSVWNMYGPTETTVWSMVCQVNKSNNSVPLGHPIANTQIHLLQYPACWKDDPHIPVSVGEIGEIYIGGHGMARGYLNRPELTCQKFINDPFSNEPGARLYRTGDLARYLPNGELEMIGRSDHQVKIRGYRIELGDIEAALSQHPAVRESIAIAREDSPGVHRLVAYVVLNSPSKSEIRSTQLQAWLKEKLPDYMVPAIVVFMDALPLTPNCKVDRRALPVPALDAREEIVPPRTELEKKLSQIWTSVLGMEVGIYHNFFETGGDSLRTALLLCRIRESFKVELSLECLFKAPTIAGLAEIIQVIQSSGSAAEFETTPAQLWADAVLDEAIRPLKAARFESKHIFLTGATGFIGAFLLCELLQQTQASIYCLVRANSLEAAGSRLRRSLENYEIWQEAFGKRIIPVVGDLSQPLFGLSQQHFQELADRIDVIYHSGAYVNLVYPYTALRQANVEGTREILRLATQNHTKPIHYISTLDVFQSSNYEGMDLILETDELLSCEGYLEGYSQSKWVAEKLVMAARDRGLPVCIYRLGMITGHSQTGAFQLDNTICRMIKGFIQLGYAPELELLMTLAPVNYVVPAIEYLSRQPESCGKTFHLLSPHVLPISQLVADISALGYEVTCIPYQQWQLKLLDMSLENALTPMATLLTRRLPNKQQTFLETATFVSQAFDFRNTQLGLAGTNIICPPINSSVLKAYLSYFIRKGFLPQQTQVIHTP